MKNRIVNPDEKTAEQSAPKNRGRFSRLVNQVLSGEFLTREGVVSHLPFLLYLTLFFLLSIYIGYTFDNTEREKVRVKRELEELGAEYKTLKSELETKKRQSSVARSIQQLGLKEPNRPPVVIEADLKALEKQK